MLPPRQTAGVPSFLLSVSPSKVVRGYYSSQSSPEIVDGFKNKRLGKGGRGVRGEIWETRPRETYTQNPQNLKSLVRSLNIWIL